MNLGVSPTLLMDRKKNCVACETDLGGRAEQQDDYLIHPNFMQIDQKIYHLFGIFDGHGRYLQVIQDLKVDMLQN